MKESSLRLDFPALLAKDIKCNLNCMNCHKDYFPVNVDFNLHDTLKFSDSIKLVLCCYDDDKLSKLSNKIIISGRAEPLLLPEEMIYDELLELRNSFPKMKIQLTTNGLNLDKRLLQFINIGLDSINLSIHNPHSINSEFYRKLFSIDEEYNKKIKLNIIIREHLYPFLEDIIVFTINNKTSAKFFHPLEAKHPEKILDEFQQFIKPLVSKYTSKIENNRMQYYFEDRIFLSIKLFERHLNRPQNCSSCKYKLLCIEGCWSSIRITPWYIKPCGVREDNVYYFHEKSKTALKNKLISGSKL